MKNKPGQNIMGITAIFALFRLARLDLITTVLVMSKAECNLELVLALSSLIFHP